MALHRSVAFFTTNLAALTFAVSTSAQGPWVLTIRPDGPLAEGACTPVRLELLDAARREAPRNPAGARVSIADFDMTMTGPGVVGRYDGASAWSACACPASAGATATIMATYPARLLAERARVPGVAFQSSITVPVVAGRSRGVPIGCEGTKTTTVGTGREVVPWTATLIAGVSALPIGACSPIQIDLRDATGKDAPRNPAGQRVSLADFDLTLAGVGVAGQSTGVASWSACGCQGAAIGAPATITATYPARELAEGSRVPGVAFQSSITLPLAAAVGTFNPPACLTPPAAPVTAVSGVAVAGSPVAGAPVATAAAGATTKRFIMRVHAFSGSAAGIIGMAPPFDPTLGTLDSVRVGITGTLTVSGTTLPFMTNASGNATGLVPTPYPYSVSVNQRFVGAPGFFTFDNDAVFRWQSQTALGTGQPFSLTTPFSYSFTLNGTTDLTGAGLSASASGAVLFQPPSGASGSLAGFYPNPVQNYEVDLIQTWSAVNQGAGGVLISKVESVGSISVEYSYIPKP